MRRFLTTPDGQVKPTAFSNILVGDLPLAVLRSNVTNLFEGETVFNLNGSNLTFIAADNDVLFKNGASQTIFGVSGAQAYTLTQSPGDNSTKVATTAYVDVGLGTKQATLVSGTNIKTINSTTVLGSGNFDLVNFSNQTGITGTKAWSDAHTFASSPSAPQNTTSERFGASVTASTFTHNVLIGQSITGVQNHSVALGYGVNLVLNDYDYNANSFGGAQTLIGYQAGLNGGKGTAIGYQASADNREAVAIGPKSQALALATVAIGDGARAFANNSGGFGNEVVIGDAVYARNNVNFILGGGHGIEHDFCMSIGGQGANSGYSLSATTATHQAFLGWYDETSTYFSAGQGLYNDFWFGGPVSAAIPHAISFNITDRTGTNQNGVRFVFNGSGGTGTGTPGTIVFAPTILTSSGAGAQTNNDRLEVNHLGIGVYPTNNANNMPFMTTAWGQSSSAVNAIHGVNVGISGGSFFRQNTSQAGFGLGYSNVSENNVFGIAVSSGGTVTHPFSFDTSNGNIKTNSAGQFVFTSSATARTGTVDTGLSRSAAGVIKFTDGSSGNGSAITAGLTTGYVAKTALYTLTSADYTVEVTSGTHTQTLPTAVGIAGKIFVITNSGSGTVTVGTTSTQTFVNVLATPTTLTLAQFQTVVVQSNGANWLRISTL